MRWSWKRPSIPEQYQPWLTENGWWLNFLALALAVFALIVAFQKGNWAPWMGFSGKTVWDWLDLLGVPLTLAILGYILQQQERKRAETLEEQERVRAEALSREQRARDEKVAKEQREIAANEAKEEILQVYFDRLSTLLVDKNILAIAAKVCPPSEKQGNEQLEITITPEEKELFDSAVDIIRARTLSILRRFEGDTDRKTSIIRFLLEAEIISKVKLDLSKADLSDADLRGADLRRAKLFNANLTRVKFQRGWLCEADLYRANLTEANLYKANLIKANFGEANLSSADLSNADLNEAYFWDAKLIKANFRQAHNLTDKQLTQAKLCFTTLPDGSTLDPNRDCEELGIDLKTGE